MARRSASACHSHKSSAQSWMQNSRLLISRVLAQMTQKVRRELRASGRQDTSAPYPKNGGTPCACAPLRDAPYPTRQRDGFATCERFGKTVSSPPLSVLSQNVWFVFLFCYFIWDYLTIIYFVFFCLPRERL